MARECSPCENQRPDRRDLLAYPRDGTDTSIDKSAPPGMSTQMTVTVTDISKH